MIIRAADPLPETCRTVGSSEVCATPLSSIVPLFGNILNVIIGLAAIALFAMLVVGGFKFITSSSNPKQLEASKHTITYAILGMVLVASAYFIIQLIEAFTGADLSNFSFPT